MPGTTAQEKALAEVREVFAVEYAAAVKPEEKRALAKVLHGERFNMDGWKARLTAYDALAGKVRLPADRVKLAEQGLSMTESARPVQ